MRLGPLMVRCDFAVAEVAEALDRALDGPAVGPAHEAAACRIEFRWARRALARRRGLAVQGTFGQGEWRVRHAGRFLRWEARGRGLDSIRVSLALSGDEVEDGYIVRSFLRFFMAETLARLGGVALHAASVARPEGAAVFMARSGGGKTTLVRRFGRDGGLGDDFVIVAPAGGTYHVLPSPVAGREGTPVPGRAAVLWRLCEMEKGDATRVEPLRPPEQVAAVLRHVILFTRDVAARRALLDTVLRLVREVGVVRLRQSLDTPPWEALRDA